MKNGIVGNYFSKVASNYFAYIKSKKRKNSLDSIDCHALANYYLVDGACLLGDTANLLEKETGLGQCELLNLDIVNGRPSCPLRAFLYTAWFLQRHLKCAYYLSEISKLDVNRSQLEIEQIDRELANLNSRSELEKVFPEKFLECESTGNYLLLDEDTKHRTRMLIEAKANKSGKSVISVASDFISDLCRFQSDVLASRTYHRVETAAVQNRWISSSISASLALLMAYFALPNESNYL